MLFLSLGGPESARAGFLSDILGTEVRADLSSTLNAETNNNSQTMALLQANVAGIPLKNDKKEPLESSPNGSIVADSAILPNTSPLSASGGSEEDFSLGDKDIEIYVVRAGDSVESIAKLFDVSVDTILSANDIKKGEKLKAGDVLLILPFSGVEHTVEKGQTLQSIANKYKVSLRDILDANDLDLDAKLAIGEKLMIPGGGILTETKPGGDKGTTNKPKTTKSDPSSKIASVAGYFKNPVPGSIKSRGVKPGHKGVDMAAPTGTPIYAAAGGTVLIARNGYNGGFGNYVVIQHSNGTKTLYAHMSKLGTTPGAKASQGELIGYVGSTGHSTGPHLHFEVLGGKNPF